MKNLFIKFCIFCALVLLADQSFGYIMDGLLKTTDTGDWGRNNYICNKLNTDIIIMGSSRAIRHFDPTIVTGILNKSCYNIGEDGMGILLMYVRYQNIIKRHIPDLIIYEIEPAYDLFPDDHNRYLNYIRPMYEDSSSYSMIQDINQIECIKLHSGFYRYNSKVLDIINQRFNSSPEKSKDYKYHPRTDTMKYEPSNQPIVQSIEYDSLKIKYLEDLIASCKSNGIQFVFTASPKYKQNDNLGFQKIYELCETYDVAFLNHYCDKNFIYNRDLFADQSHLNITGAERFTLIIANEINSIQNQRLSLNTNY